MGYILGGIAAGVLIGYPFGGFLFEFLNEAAPFIIISVCSLMLLCKYDSKSLLRIFVLKAV